MDKGIICGIYKITSPSGRVYIGQSEDIQKRFNQYRFISNTRNQIKLQRSFKKHSIIKHTFEVIEECLFEELLCRERYWQDFYDVLNGGLNCILTSCGDEKQVMDESTKQRISNTKMNTPQTDAQKEYNKSKFGKKKPKHPKWLKNNSESIKKPITQYSLNCEFIKDWRSAKDVEDEVGLSRKAISKNLRGGSKSSFGYIWKYKINNLIINRMDEFLKPNAAYERLIREYKKYGSLIVAVDFDSTLYDFHGIGESYEQVRQLVRDLHKANCYIIIWTGNQNIEFVTTFLKENNIPFDSINDEAPVSKKVLGDSIPRKVYANVYLDDRGGLEQVYNDLRKLLYNLNKKTFYRVAHRHSGQGLWYDSLGSFTGLIHDKFSFCKNKDLGMDFDPELVGWLSATDSLETLYQWFTEEDIIELQKHGWYIAMYETDDYKFYDRFQHYVVNKNNIKFLDYVVLDERV